MAKDQPAPLVSVAAFCERVLKEDDGTISVMRIVDTGSMAIPLGLPKDVMPATSITYLLTLKSGDFKGRGHASLRVRNPEGAELIPPEKPGTPVELQGGVHGMNLVYNLAIPYVGDGVYWVEALFDGEMLTRTPLRLQQFAQKTEIRSRPDDPPQ